MMEGTLSASGTFFILVKFVSFLLIGTVCKAERGYLVTHPRVLRPGTEHIAVTIFDPTEPILVTVRLKVRNETVTSSERSILGKGIFQLQIPEYVRGRATLEVCGNCLRAGTSGYHFQNSTDVAVSPKSSSVFIQIDKPVYKPGQIVLINFIITGPDLKPKDQDVFAYIEDPKGSRMVQWRELNKQCCGLRNASFPLSDQPILGEWKIFAVLKNRVHNKTFKVEKYVLPKFEVLIHPPRFIVDINRCRPASVEARYTYGEPVKGKVSINMKLVGIGYYDNYVGHNEFIFKEIDGVANFNICVSNMVSSALSPYFRGAVVVEASVTSSDGHVFTAQDDSCLVRRQPIGVKYTVDTVNHFKPGLPYEGKLSVFFPDDSIADKVTVRLKAESNHDPFYQEDLISENGEMAFKIDWIPSDLSLVWISAEITQWRGHSPGGTYNPVYHSIRRWYSPSGCYIQTKLLNRKLKVGDYAVVGVLSSCMCNVSLHYHLTARGDIVHSGVKQPHHDDITTIAINDTVLCKTAISFRVTHMMTPATQLLVYYLKEDNETVADNLPLQVEPTYENEVDIRFSANLTTPGSKLTMTVSAKPGSCVCVGSVDQSIQLMDPGYELNTKQIFEEMNSFSLRNPQGPDTWWTGPRWSSTYTGTSHLLDSYQAFKASGLHMMTDVVQLRFYSGDDEPEHEALPLQEVVRERSRQLKRAYFPETWMWNCFNISSARKQEHFRLHLPDTLTTWSTQAFALSETHGFGLSRQSSLVSRKHFFIDVTLPYSTIRGEQLQVPVSVYNYQDICVQVVLTVILPEGSQFVDSEEQTRTETLCLQERETQTIHLDVEFAVLGKNKIIASADVHTAFGCCTDDIIGDVVIARDKVVRSLIVQPEGIPRAYTYSVFFCPNERIHLSTPNRYEFQFMRRPPTINFLTFMCKASNDARIALAPSKNSQFMYEIVIGGWSNSRTWISRKRNGEEMASTPTAGILDRNEFRAFWISWAGGLVQVGTGENPSNESLLVEWLDESPHSVNYIGFSTGFGSSGEFRIWKKRGNSEMFIEAFTLTLPLNYIPGSEKARAVMLADVMGPTLGNLQRLIRLPFGCGEQNMIHFAPNIYVLSYLERTTQLTHAVKAEATRFLVRGYQRQLTYKRHDGSYSAFGESDTSGSMWLTAFVLKSFAQSRAYIYIDPLELSTTKSWVMSQQLKDGSFPLLGTVLNKDIQGGVQGMISLTAYVVVALLETGLDSYEERQSALRAQQFLESNIHGIQDSYTAALTAYALTLQDSHMAPEAVRVLTSKEIYSDGMRYWSLNGQPHEVLPHFNVMGDFQWTVASAEVEMTAYALLTYTARRDIAYSLPIVKWLTRQRNSLGGFSSTQDTCVALQALSEYAALSYVRDVNLTISLGYIDCGESVERVYHIDNQNSKVMQTVQIPALSQNLFLRSTGEGCGLLQVDVNYNIPDPHESPSFRLNIDLVQPLSEQLGRGKRETGGTQRMKAKVAIKACTRWLHAGSSNMAVIEVDLASGFTAIKESLERLLLDRHSKVRRYEVEGRKVVLYFDEIPSQCMTCVTFIAEQEFLVRKIHPVPVKVYDYYEPHYEAVRMYNITSEVQDERGCEGEQCNEIEGAGSHGNPVRFLPQALHLCNMVDGDCMFMADQIICSCERTCSYGGPPVCGSDRVRYDNLCHMEVAACHKDQVITVEPLEYCEVAPTNGGVIPDEEAPQPSIPLTTEEGRIDLIHPESGNSQYISHEFSDIDTSIETFSSYQESDSDGLSVAPADNDQHHTDTMWLEETEGTRSKVTQRPVGDHKTLTDSETWFRQTQTETPLTEEDYRMHGTKTYNPKVTMGMEVKSTIEVISDNVTLPLNKMDHVDLTTKMIESRRVNKTTEMAESTKLNKSTKTGMSTSLYSTFESTPSSLTNTSTAAENGNQLTEAELNKTAEGTRVIESSIGVSESIMSSVRSDVTHIVGDISRFARIVESAEEATGSNTSTEVFDGASVGTTVTIPINGDDLSDLTTKKVKSTTTEFTESLDLSSTIESTTSSVRSDMTQVAEDEDMSTEAGLVKPREGTTGNGMNIGVLDGSSISTTVTIPSDDGDPGILNTGQSESTTSLDYSSTSESTMQPSARSDRTHMREDESRSTKAKFAEPVEGTTGSSGPSVDTTVTLSSNKGDLAGLTTKRFNESTKRVESTKLVEFITLIDFSSTTESTKSSVGRDVTHIAKNEHTSTKAAKGTIAGSTNSDVVASVSTTGTASSTTVMGKGESTEVRTDVGGETSVSSTTENPQGKANEQEVVNADAPVLQENIEEDETESSDWDSVYHPNMPPTEAIRLVSNGGSNKIPQHKKRKMT